MMSLLQKHIVHEDLIAGTGKVMGVGARDVVDYDDMRCASAPV